MVTQSVGQKRKKERMIKMGVVVKRPRSRYEQNIKKQLTQAQSDLADAQLLAAQQAADNATMQQSITDLQMLVAAQGGDK